MSRALKIWFVGGWLFYGALGFGAGAKLRELPVSELAKVKAQPCTFLHMWATWCDICVKELPELIKYFAQHKKMTPVIVDVSTPFVQENFSRKWSVLLEAPFSTYLKPAGDDQAYLLAVDATWSGGLPFSALYHKGVKKTEWLGAVTPAQLTEATRVHCR